MIIRGSTVALRPATQSDLKTAYDWLARSDLTALMMSSPTYPDMPIPTEQEFCADYLAHFSDDSASELGRCFIIMAEGEDAGVVCYNEINKARRETELDIWLKSSAYSGKGYGPDALEALCAELHRVYGIENFVIRPSARNPRAIKAYQRAGFEVQNVTAEEQQLRYGPGDCSDTMVLVKRMSA